MKVNPKRLFRKIASSKFGKFVSKNAPWILTGVGIVGMGGTVVLASKATLETKEFMDKLVAEGKDFKDIETKEKVIILAKNYAAPAITFISSAACLCGSTKIGAKRAAAFAASYELSQKLLDELRTNMRENLGEEKAKEIEEEAQKKVVSEIKHVEPKHGRGRYGNDIFIDSITGREFYDDINHIRETACKFSEKLLNTTMSASLNEFYDELDNPDLPHVEAGLYLGWNCDCIPIPSFSATMTKDGHAAIYFSWEPGRRPFANFENF